MMLTDDINPANYYGCALDLDADDKRHEKLQRQRRERGFDDSETWCLRSAILGFTLPRLKRFREIGCSFCHPSDMTEKEWDTAVDEMIFAIEAVLDWDDDWELDDTPERKAHHDRVMAGMKLFHDRFMDLWW